MNEGVAHTKPKHVIGQAMASLDLRAIARNSDRFATTLGERHGLADGAALNRWALDLPIYVMGDVLGFGSAELPALALWMTVSDQPPRLPSWLRAV